MHLSQFKTDFMAFKGLKDEAEKANLEIVGLHKVRPLIDGNIENCKRVANSSTIFRSPSLLRKLLSINIEDSDKQLLLMSYLFRGILNTITILGTEYVSFLKQCDLLNLLIEKVK